MVGASRSLLQLQSVRWLVRGPGWARGILIGLIIVGQYVLFSSGAFAASPSLTINGRGSGSCIVEGTSPDDMATLNFAGSGFAPGRAVTLTGKSNLGDAFAPISATADQSGAFSVAYRLWIGETQTQHWEAKDSKGTVAALDIIAGRGTCDATPTSTRTSTPTPVVSPTHTPTPTPTHVPVATDTPADAPTDTPTDTSEASPEPIPALAETRWLGYTSGSLNVRSARNTSSAIVGTLDKGDSVAVSQWVGGEVVLEDNETWGTIAPGQYVYSALLRKNVDDGPPSPPEDAIQDGNWIDVNLTQQTIAAYNGDELVYWAVVSTGRPKYPSPTGTFDIIRRVANETMRSATLSIVTDFYDIPNVLFTQYLTWSGIALHENHWKTANSPWGVPTSHGCVGMQYDDAKWFWDWAKLGTPVVMHE